MGKRQAVQVESALPPGSIRGQGGQPEVATEHLGTMVYENEWTETQDRECNQTDGRQARACLGDGSAMVGRVAGPGVVLCAGWKLERCCVLA